jgi:hypothetical protein
MFPFCYSVLEYELLNLQIPTINIVGSLVKSGIRVLVYRYNAKRFVFVVFLNSLGISHEVQDSLIRLEGRQKDLEDKK